MRGTEASDREHVSLEAAFRDGLITEDDIQSASASEIHEMLVSLSPIAALRMSDAFGGMQIKVPLTPGDESSLRVGVGDEFAEEICHMLGMCVIYVPQLRGLKRLIRDRRARQLSDNGCSVTEIARRYGLSQRGVFRILSRQRQEQQEAES